jgi:Xaa-Pro aminopeptidase
VTVQRAALPAPDLAALPLLTVGDRLHRLRHAVAGSEVDGIILTDLVSIRWLTGFSGSNAMVLVDPDRVLFATDGRYGEQAAEQLARHGLEAALEVVTRRSDQQQLMADATASLGRLALEADAVTWAEQRTYAADWFAGSVLVATTGLVAELRRVKDAAEVARIEAASAIADAALAELRVALLESPSERDFAVELERRMVDLGAEGPSFPTICAAGPNSARPHAEPGDRAVRGGDLVVLDFGALVDGYHSDMTRTLAIGEPSAEQSLLIEAATVAQARGAAAVRPGVTAHAVDRACRDALAERGLEDLLVHGTGHGVGLVIHETPILRPGADEELSQGEVVTVEPGVYRPGAGGARIEDTVLVTAGGCRSLTLAPKDPVVA